MGTMQTDEQIIKEHDDWYNSGRNTSNATGARPNDDLTSVPASEKANIKAQNDKGTQYYAHAHDDYSTKGGNGMPSNIASAQDKDNAANRKYSKTGANGMPSDVAIKQDSINAATRKNASASSSSKSSGSSKTAKNLAVGDKVQIKNGGIDVTNGAKAVKGKMYGESGPYWATITSITKDYSTGSRYGLPAKITP